MPNGKILDDDDDDDEEEEEDDADADADADTDADADADDDDDDWIRIPYPNYNLFVRFPSTGFLTNFSIWLTKTSVNEEWGQTKTQSNFHCFSATDRETHTQETNNLVKRA